MLKWLTHEDAPLLFRLRADLRQWLWMLQFLRECTPGRTHRNIEHIDLVRRGRAMPACVQSSRAIDRSPDDLTTYRV